MRALGDPSRSGLLLALFAASATVTCGRGKRNRGDGWANTPALSGAHLRRVLACSRWRWCDVHGRVVHWRRGSAWLWMLAGLVALLCLLWGGRRMARGVNEHAWRAIEECGAAIAPLLLFALLWLIVDPPPRPDGQAGLAWKVRMFPPA
jgi:hypothetical protein